MLDQIVDNYPKDIELKDKSKCIFRPLEKSDESLLLRFFQNIPEQERLFIKHRVTDPAVIKEWCNNIDLGRNFPLVALINKDIAGLATLHQQLGGWRRHIGRVSVLVSPQYRGRGLARTLVGEIVTLAGDLSLERVEAEFLAEQAAAIHLFDFLDFKKLVTLPDYVKDMQANTHDYVLMAKQLVTDEEYAGMG
jgi:L-amino acid N-acyltransferase YncA